VHGKIDESSLGKQPSPPSKQRQRKPRILRIINLSAKSWSTLELLIGFNVLAIRVAYLGRVAAETDRGCRLSILNKSEAGNAEHNSEHVFRVSLSSTSPLVEREAKLDLG
jgi:hypothetical protein